jgi:hypothetical protein
MNLFFAFLAGMFLTNGVPHFTTGIAGGKHMTPFAKDSNAIINIFWAFINFLFGALLMNLAGGRFDDLITFDNIGLSFWSGSLFMALADAWLFSNPNAKFPWFKK